LSLACPTLYFAYCSIGYNEVLTPPLGVTVGGIMLGENKERWQELCSQAAVEQDPKRLLQLMEEINGLLEAKKKRLLESRSSEAKSESP